MSERRTTRTTATGDAGPRPLVLSLRPRFAEAILDGSKTIELRRTRLQAPTGTSLVLYAASPVMAVVGVATLAGVETASPNRIWQRHRLAVTLDRTEFDIYFANLRPSHDACRDRLQASSELSVPDRSRPSRAAACGLKQVIVSALPGDHCAAAAPPAAICRQSAQQCVNVRSQEFFDRLAPGNG
ncbi:ASCH domain-containing protein [Amycolatopsis speibonae]|uniref:ASCH domain-containing protein n=1 Tax=Amycolatopsis speibonae TaxID=1450224 RepID=A0ABV7P0U3_9PSEU